tara:strand:- start:116 stop:376 length:261 start_codon:yes stop_codon:yes gene_type:complete
VVVFFKRCDSHSDRYQGIFFMKRLLLISLLLLPLNAFAQTKINLEYQDQFGNWKHYQTKHNQEDAYRTAKRRAEATGKRHRLVDDA